MVLQIQFLKATFEGYWFTSPNSIEFDFQSNIKD